MLLTKSGRSTIIDQAGGDSRQRTQTVYVPLSEQGHASLAISSNGSQQSVTCICIMPSHGRLPVHISQSSTPKAYTSTLLLRRPVVSSSGGMCVTVPKVPVLMASCDSTLLSPKSATCANEPLYHIPCEPLHIVFHLDVPSSRLAVYRRTSNTWTLLVRRQPCSDDCGRKLALRESGNLLISHTLL